MHSSGAVLAYSGVPPGIGVLTFFGDLSSSLPCSPHIVTLPSSIGTPMFLRNLCIHLVRFFAYSDVPRGIGGAMFVSDV